MPRFLRYDEALAYANGRTRLSREGLVRGLDATPAAADAFLRRMEADGVIGPAEPDGAHPVLGAQRRRWSAPMPAETAPAGMMGEDVARLRAERDAALRRAESAEAAAAARLATLRRMLARELHPDSAASAGTTALQEAYQEIFQRVWPRIEAVLSAEGED